MYKLYAVCLVQFFHSLFDQQAFCEIRKLWVMENYPAVNIFCELWPFGTYDPDTRRFMSDSRCLFTVCIIWAQLYFFQQIIGIPMGTNCARLLADIFLYSYEAEFIQSLLPTVRTRLASQFIYTYRNIDDVLSINNPDFEHYLGQMYSLELEI